MTDRETTEYEMDVEKIEELGNIDLDGKLLYDSEEEQEMDIKATNPENVNHNKESPHTPEEKTLEIPENINMSSFNARVNLISPDNKHKLQPSTFELSEDLETSPEQDYKRSLTTNELLDVLEKSYNVDELSNAIYEFFNRFEPDVFTSIKEKELLYGLKVVDQAISKLKVSDNDKLIATMQENRTGFFGQDTMSRFNRMRDLTLKRCREKNKGDFSGFFDNISNNIEANKDLKKDTHSITNDNELGVKTKKPKLSLWQRITKFFKKTIPDFFSNLFGTKNSHVNNKSPSENFKKATKAVEQQQTELVKNREREIEQVIKSNDKGRGI